MATTITIKQAILGFMGFLPANPDALTLQCINQGIDPDVNYDVSVKIQCVKAAIGLLQLLLSTADTRTSNDSGQRFDAIYDREAILKLIDQLKGENGLTDESRPYITSRDVW